MSELQRKALVHLPLSEATVESFYDGSRSGTAEQCLKALCLSHERLRAELQGAEALLNEEVGKASLRGLLTACKEMLNWLRRLNDFPAICRALIDTKIDLDDMAIVLSNLLRRLNNAVEQVEGSIAPQRKVASDFEEWLSETFYGRDHDFKMEAVSHAHILDHDQAVRLASHIWSCMENAPPPWWSRQTAEKEKMEVIAAWRDGTITEGQAAQLAGLDRVSLRDLLQQVCTRVLDRYKARQASLSRIDSTPDLS